MLHLPSTRDIRLYILRPSQKKKSHFVTTQEEVAENWTQQMISIVGFHNPALDSVLTTLWLISLSASHKGRGGIWKEFILLPVCMDCGPLCLSAVSPFQEYSLYICFGCSLPKSCLSQRQASCLLPKPSPALRTEPLCLYLASVPVTAQDFTQSETETWEDEYWSRCCSSRNLQAGKNCFKRKVAYEHRVKSDAVPEDRHSVGMWDQSKQ